MNLKGIMQTLGAKPGQVMSDPYARAFAPQPTIKEAEGEDHEVSMAQNALDSIIKHATELKGKIGQGEKDIPAWIQDHITNSENYISQAASNYHEYGTNESGINGAPRYPSTDGVANESVNEGRGVKSLAKELFAVAEQIQGYVEIYKKKKGTPDEKKIVEKLKKLNAEKKELEKRMDTEVSSLYRDAELQIEGTVFVNEANPSKKEQDIYNQIEKLRVAANSGKITGAQFMDKFHPLWKQLKSITKESINEGFEVHYSDGVRASKKFGNEKQAVQFAKDLIKNKKGLQFVDVFNAGSGFHSTADTDAIVAWWGKGSYTDNKSKKDSKLAAKKIKESLRLNNIK